MEVITMPKKSKMNKSASRRIQRALQISLVKIKVLNLELCVLQINNLNNLQISFISVTSL